MKKNLKKFMLVAIISMGAHQAIANSKLVTVINSTEKKVELENNVDNGAYRTVDSINPYETKNINFSRNTNSRAQTSNIKYKFKAKKIYSDEVKADHFELSNITGNTITIRNK